MAELSVHQSVLLTDLALCVNHWRLFSPGWYVCVMAGGAAGLGHSAVDRAMSRIALAAPLI
jgi:hypothetical protein